MNKEIMSIKDKLKNKSKEKGIDYNVLMLLHVYDRLIARLSKSEYKNNFILKGGFYLSSILGIDNRTTKDIDTLLKGADLNETQLRKMISSIISIDLEDNIFFEIDNIVQIKKQDEYNGYRVNLKYKFGNEINIIQIDVATGDTIYPRAIKYKYKDMLTDEEFNVLAYNLETILAEKIETILRLGETSSRMKDYYDVYIIDKLMKDSINTKVLKEACKRTFKARGLDISKINIDNLKDSEILKKRWKAYVEDNEYAKEISYKTTVEVLEILLENN